jgi:hypothetical protein
MFSLIFWLFSAAGPAMGAWVKPRGTFLLSCGIHVKKKVAHVKPITIETKNCTEFYGLPSQFSGYQEACQMEKESYEKLGLKLLESFKQKSTQKCPQEGAVLHCSNGFKATYYYLLQDISDMSKNPYCKNLIKKNP